MFADIKFVYFPLLKIINKLLLKRLFLYEYGNAHKLSLVLTHRCQ